MSFSGKIKYLGHSLFHGLRNADEKMLAQINNGAVDGTDEERHVQSETGVMNDILQRKETQQVKELRDETYRVYREAEKYKVRMEGEIRDNDGNLIGYSDIKTEKVDNNREISPERAPEDIIMNGDDKLVLIQKTGMIMKGLAEMGDVMEDNPIPTYTLKIERDYFPKFKVEKYAKKLVLRRDNTLNEHQYYFDLYCSVYPEEYKVIKGFDNTRGNIDKSDIFFIQEVKDLMNKKITTSDIVDFSTLEFITDKAFNADALKLYKFDEIEFIDVLNFNGYFVIRFKGNAICDGFDMIQKYHTDELDAKIENKEMKTDTYILDQFTTNGAFDDNVIEKDLTLKKMK